MEDESEALYTAGLVANAWLRFASLKATGKQWQKVLRHLIVAVPFVSPIPNVKVGKTAL